MLKSEQIKKKLESLEEQFKDAEANRDDLLDELNNVQDQLDEAEYLVSSLEDEIWELEEELVEVIREEETTDPAELERYHASKDKRQEDLDL